MEFLAIEGWKLTILMGTGAVFSAVALYLLIKPRDGDQQAQFKAFGIESSFSSTGMLLLLIGALFLATPLFVPVKPSIANIQQPTDEEGRKAVPLTGAQRVEAAGEEVEPNNTIVDANLVALGSLTMGHALIDNYDTFCVQNGEATNLLFTFSKNGGSTLNARFYYRNGKSIRDALTIYDDPVNLPLEVDQPETCVTLRPNGNFPPETWYQFSVAVE